MDRSIQTVNQKEKSRDTLCRSIIMVRTRKDEQINKNQSKILDGRLTPSPIDGDMNSFLLLETTGTGRLETEEDDKQEGEGTSEEEKTKTKKRGSEEEKAEAGVWLRRVGRRVIELRKGVEEIITAKNERQKEEAVEEVEVAIEGLEILRLRRGERQEHPQWVRGGGEEGKQCYEDITAQFEKVITVKFDELNVEQLPKALRIIKRVMNLCWEIMGNWITWAKVEEIQKEGRNRDGRGRLPQGMHTYSSTWLRNSLRHILRLRRPCRTSRSSGTRPGRGR